MTGKSAVEFATEARLHVALESSDVERSSRFYAALFGQEPSKARPGYVKFEVESSPLNLTLNQVVAGVRRTAGVSHFGVQVKSREAVAVAKQRLEQAGISIRVEENVTCCYAVQDKVWVDDPDGNAWEVFVTLDDDAAGPADPAAGCCTGVGAELVALP
ncbi:MAG: ArsI/CadI family heavy metal resistance metalloenzyme [Acidobacteria bacterium]|nr:ArsI/CadI family heavy metal resistance metalloenzyme [Acidobacteriota bacterium]MDA1234405.1 ArsI/CadI family heavy metal resistance metalloenzyme [Acidobacteriota bacterium]